MNFWQLSSIQPRSALVTKTTVPYSCAIRSVSAAASATWASCSRCHAVSSELSLSLRPWSCTHVEGSTVSSQSKMKTVSSVANLEPKTDVGVASPSGLQWPQWLLETGGDSVVSSAGGAGGVSNPGPAAGSAACSGDFAGPLHTSALCSPACAAALTGSATSSTMGAPFASAGTLVTASLTIVLLTTFSWSMVIAPALRGVDSWQGMTLS
mmetsp:Transcript_44849/g.126871  ORF Transcript_44849/g.126871 Transcript_44849/m.126871 type:complete len:210 (-) Transcript_44849:6-635(-)